MAAVLEAEVGPRPAPPVATTLQLVSDRQAAGPWLAAAALAHRLHLSAGRARKLASSLARHGAAPIAIDPDPSVQFRVMSKFLSDFIYLGDDVAHGPPLAWRRPTDRHLTCRVAPGHTAGQVRATLNLEAARAMCDGVEVASRVAAQQPRLLAQVRPGSADTAWRSERFVAGLNRHIERARSVLHAHVGDAERAFARGRRFQKRGRRRLIDARLSHDEMMSLVAGCEAGRRLLVLQPHWLGRRDAGHPTRLAESVEELSRLWSQQR